MNGKRGNFTRIKGVSDRRRLPRLGKIRLGLKAIAKSGKEYPKETDYFVVPPEVAAVYGAEPKELDIFFPVDDMEIVFPQRLCWFGASKGPKCIGDGERAMRVNVIGDFEDRECPCPLLEQKECRQIGSLLFILPKVSVGGIYQIDVSSYHSIVDLNSGMDYVQALVGRLARVPLKLKRVPRETHGSGRKEVHYCLQIQLDANAEGLQKLIDNAQGMLKSPAIALPPAELANPALDEGPVEKAAEGGKNGSPKPETSQGPGDPLEEKFKAIIPAGVDRARLDEFMETCGGFYKQTLVQVKESAIFAPEDFFSTFQAWMKKHSKEGKKECPDRGQVDSSCCSSCGTREGCPAW